MDKNLKNQLPIHWKIIVSTIAVCAALFGFIYFYTFDIKKEQTKLLEIQIELFKTQYRVLEDKYNDCKSSKKGLENQNIESKNKKNLKLKSVNNQNRTREITKDFKLYKDEIYYFPSNENYTLKVTEIDNFKKQVKVEFNLKGIIKSESLQINKTRFFPIDGKEYNFILKGISKVDKESVAEFFIIIKNIN